MITLFFLILASVGIVFAAERHPATCRAMQKLTRAYTPGTCRSFILDIFILLPLVGLLVEALARRIKNHKIAIFPFVTMLALFATGKSTENELFVTISYLLFFLAATITLLRWTERWMLYSTALSIFLAISGSLYLDYLNFNFLTPFLGHPEAWGGNHFMWNSGVEVLGLKPIIDTTIPTYLNFWGFWNLLAMILLGPVYILVMVKMGTWLHGLLLGYTEKQTGISALFWERKTR